MLASLVEEMDDRPGWYYEPKLDGYRALAAVGRQVHLYSRNDKSFNAHYPPVIQALKQLGHKALLDGEVVCLDGEGRPRFQLLQDWRENPKGELRYYVFDLLHLQGRDLRGLPLSERKRILDLLPLPGPVVQACAYVEEKGSEFLELMRAQGMEGMLAKNADSLYREGERGRDWLKVKLVKEQEAVIGGYTEPRGARKSFGALVLGLYKDKDLVYVGHTGGGFNTAGLAGTFKRLQALEQKECPFKERPATNAPVHWVKPELVAQVKFQEWTSDGHMRIPIFMGLRKDKAAREVGKEEPVEPPPEEEEESMPSARKRKFNGEDHAEEDEKGGRYFGPGPAKDGAQYLKVAGREVKLTHLSKTFWPEEGYTKGDVIGYYRSMAKWILPYLKDRPESLRRHPNGIEGESFFQKNFEEEEKPYPWMKSVRIESESGETVNYLLCQNEADLLAMANLGCIEINPWNSRVGGLDRPDYAILDLDPEDIPFSKVIETAEAARRLLDAAKIPAFPKTTGSRGIHICAPLGAKYSYEQARMFIQIIAQMINAKLPGFTSLERQPSRRRKKVYLDYLQNSRGQTLACAYSLRPKPGAKVSAPLKWEEVRPGLDPLGFNIKTIQKRVEKMGDLWKPVLGPGLDLGAALRRLQRLGGPSSGKSGGPR